MWFVSRLSFVDKASTPFALCEFKKCRKKVSKRSDNIYDLVASTEYNFELPKISQSNRTAYLEKNHCFKIIYANSVKSLLVQVLIEVRGDV
jgi:hypothetical protein